SVMEPGKATDFEGQNSLGSFGPPWPSLAGALWYAADRWRRGYPGVTDEHGARPTLRAAGAGPGRRSPDRQTRRAGQTRRPGPRAGPGGLSHGPDRPLPYDRWPATSQPLAVRRTDAETPGSVSHDR